MVIVESEGVVSIDEVRLVLLSCLRVQGLTDPIPSSELEAHEACIYKIIGPRPIAQAAVEMYALSVGQRTRPGHEKAVRTLPELVEFYVQHRYRESGITRYSFDEVLRISEAIAFACISNGWVEHSVTVGHIWDVFRQVGDQPAIQSESAAASVVEDWIKKLRLIKQAQNPPQDLKWIPSVSAVYLGASFVFERIFRPMGTLRIQEKFLSDLRIHYSLDRNVSQFILALFDIAAGSGPFELDFQGPSYNLKAFFPDVLREVIVHKFWDDRDRRMAEWIQQLKRNRSSRPS